MIFYANTISPRLKYILDFFDNEIRKEHPDSNPIEFTTDRNRFTGYRGAKINYSRDRISPEECWIPPHALLFEKGIREQDTHCVEEKGRKYFFKTGGDLSFDIFAASFYLLSRYEEYLPHQKDEYGRYAHSNSLAFREGFLQIPLINTWIADFKKNLERKFEGIRVGSNSFEFIPTYDIDEAWSYRHKMTFRTLGGTIRSILKGQWSGARERLAVLAGKKKDPYDSYEWLDTLHSRCPFQPRYFFQVAGKNGHYDKNNLPTDPAMQELIREHSNRYLVGVHPSWQSNDNPSLLFNEIRTMEKICSREIIFSRQHFIRFSLPETFRRLVQAGIRNDFSMGYGSINGFRASVASSYYWYDLEKEETSSLRLYPFCFMDANSFFEQGYSPREALDEMRHYLRVINETGGLMVTIWHNTFLGTSKQYSGWREVYYQFMLEAGRHSETSGPD